MADNSECYTQGSAGQQEPQFRDNFAGKSPSEDNLRKDCVRRMHEGADALQGRSCRGTCAYVCVGVCVCCANVVIPPWTIADRSPKQKTSDWSCS
jgi:hypothetical protein